MEDDRLGHDREGLASQPLQPWYGAYAGRPWLATLAGLVSGIALLFVGVAVGGGSREHIVPVGTLVAAIIGGGIALGQLQVTRKRHEEQTKADLQRRITESFTKAVEQLGSQHLPVRAGGIYALERISRESDEDYWTVMETLTAFVREQARWKKPDPEDATLAEEPHEVPTDVAAVIAVIRRRRQQNREQEQREDWRLDLRSTDLRGIDLRKAYLKGANLVGVHLEKDFLVGAHLEEAVLRKACLNGANLVAARLEKATLREAHLEGANLVHAHFENAMLWGAHLEGAALWGTHFEKAHLGGAHFEKADLWGVHLEGANLEEAYFEEAHFREVHLEGANLLSSKGLTQDQLDGAFGDAKTQLPEGLKRPDHWT